MKGFLRIFCLAAVCAAASAMAEDTPATDKNAPNAVTITGENDQLLEFADPEQCHVKVGSTTAPVVAMLVAAHSMETVPHKQAAIRVAIDTTLLKKCDINEVDKAGLQPLNSAILFADTDMVRFLLKKGADPYQTVNRPESPVHGLNSFDFLARVEKAQRDQAEKNGRDLSQLPDYSEIKSELDQYR